MKHLKKKQKKQKTIPKEVLTTKTAQILIKSPYSYKYVNQNRLEASLFAEPAKVEEETLSNRDYESTFQQNQKRTSSKHLYASSHSSSRQSSPRNQIGSLMKHGNKKITFEKNYQRNKNLFMDTSQDPKMKQNKKNHYLKEHNNIENINFQDSLVEGVATDKNPNKYMDEDSLEQLEINVDLLTKQNNGSFVENDETMSDKKTKKYLNNTFHIEVVPNRQKFSVKEVKNYISLFQTPSGSEHSSSRLSQSQKFIQHQSSKIERALEYLNDEEDDINNTNNSVSDYMSNCSNTLRVINHKEKQNNQRDKRYRSQNNRKQKRRTLPLY
ncbi:UNKNOWN [Stylonychia lemnae]|uniref:Uncharacterized protein n=1 Tax=Stylonychia lemnae TaxID=5949 RepID=A0A078AAX4_STYLE|nr:UNKNOWN [Stylonychia lemnae]|eukprot:CDW78757.1 UNKNOWN [Stylonychia lemnae]